jgi:hypothetical protein
MARRLLGLLLVVCAACKGDSAKAPPADLDARCAKLAAACGDKDKHVDKIADGCKAAAKKEGEKGCADKASALYDCYEKEVCGKADKIWALDDMRVLAERANVCAAERTALTTCVGQ